MSLPRTPVNRRLWTGKLAQTILNRRGLRNLDSIRAFLYPDYYHPSPAELFPGVEQAVAVLVAALGQGQRLGIYGDYDVDGVTATALLVQVMTGLGFAVEWMVPDRFQEGYGLHPGAVEAMAEAGVKVLVTCDCGSTAGTAVERARQLGIDVIITDHHQLPPVVPEAVALVSTQLLPAGHPARNLAGVGVALMLAAALAGRLGQPGLITQVLDLVALGTMADAVPLTGDNRYWVQRGLPVLWGMQRPGLAELIQVAGIQPAVATEEDVSFQLAPRLNAAGRMASARQSVELLLAPAGDARQLAVQLDDFNRQRRQVEEQLITEALAEVAAAGDDLPPVMAFYRPDWHQGVIGIAAGRLAGQFNRPAFLMTRAADGKVVGSARTVPGISAYQLLSSCADLLTHFGGHEAAAGFGLQPEQVPLLVKRLAAATGSEAGGALQDTGLEADAEVSLADVTSELYDQLRLLAPFGVGNPEPRLVVRGAEVLKQQATGDGRHLRLTLAQGANSCNGIWWRAGGREEQAQGPVDAVFRLGRNRWQDRVELQLVIEGMLPSVDYHEVTNLPRWLDRRGQIIEELLEPQAIVYCEGISPCPGAAGRNRLQIATAPVLVLASIPPGPVVLAELLARARPREVVLAYNDPLPEDDGVFSRRLLGLAKHAWAHHGGEIHLEQLAAALGELQQAVYYGLLALAERGYLQLEWLDRQRALVRRGQSGPPVAGGSRYWEQTRLILRESQAFRRYMVQADVTDIARLLRY